LVFYIKEKYRLIVLESKALISTSIFGPKREEVIGLWRSFRDESKEDEMDESSNL
jgi:hypothetical protein